MRDRDRGFRVAVGAIVLSTACATEGVVAGLTIYADQLNLQPLLTVFIPDTPTALTPSQTPTKTRTLFPTSTLVPFPVHELRGTGIDEGDYLKIVCFDLNKFAPVAHIPKAGVVENYPNESGAVVSISSVDPAVCKNEKHPDGAQNAIVIVYDHNPNISAGFPVNP